MTLIKQTQGDDVTQINSIHVARYYIPTNALPCTIIY